MKPVSEPVHALPHNKSMRRIPLAGAFALVLLLLILHLSAGVPLMKPTLYDTYTRQALAWRNGTAYLPEDVPHLELAIYDGRYYVSFPPVPSLLMLPLTLVFGPNTPDALLMVAYALVAFYAIFRLFVKAGWGAHRASLAAFLLCAGSSMLPMLLTGAVWYHAQVLAFVLTMLAMERMAHDKPTTGLLCYALAVGCRPFNALYGPLLMALYLFPQSTRCSLAARFKRLLPGIVLGLGVAAAYALYNLHRFGNALEFGHNHLPEFSFQGGTQFSVNHIAKNVSTFVLGMPVDNENGTLHLKRFGFSMFIANPAFLCLLGWTLRDMWHRTLTWRQGAIVFTWALHLLLLLSHRTFGGYQYGARYAVDCIPYVVLFMVERKHQKALKAVPQALLMAGLLLAICGSITITLPT